MALSEPCPLTGDSYLHLVYKTDSPEHLGFFHVFPLFSVFQWLPLTYNSSLQFSKGPPVLNVMCFVCLCV